MSTILVFIMTLAQLLAVILAHLAPIAVLWDALVIYGSPMFFIMNSLGEESVAFEANMLFPLLAAFHIFKYLCLARSQFGEERRSLHFLAVIFEAIYLVICGMNLP